ncbi:ulp1 protease family, C-terminal catalytic domain-containing protein [Artemisia annua]|uniref:Ulp1 protease family, C-terminal catalytic domain-containing protein n=1 Tax=Artemisia annua TaxID=35608 RepID=A0A2U1KAH3_ARTAN|nr:ulp1 protease family, C-terminal catalytic domain-containing protein [Artemisia annua]
MCIEELKKSVPSVGIAAVRMFDLDVPSFDLGFNLTPEPKKGNEDNTPEPKKGNEDNKEDEEFEEVKSTLLDFPTDCTCPEKMTTLDPEKSIDGNSEFKTPKVHIMKPSTSNADGKGSHVICMKETYDVEPVSRIYPRQEVERVRRCIKPSGVLLSPFIERVVKLGKEMEPLEKKVCGSIFSARFNEMDVVFRAGSEDGHRIVMESLFPGIEVDRGVIDMWNLVLNDEERLRSKDSMARVFCHTQMVTDSMLSDDMDSATKHFISNMLAILEQTFSSLEHVDLVLFPIVEGNHSYLLSINLRTPQFHIIDNRKSDEMDVKKRYGRVPFFIISNLCSYLASEDHLSTMKLMVVDPVILKMGWRTNMNIVDSGVFVMRHMETYQGNGMFDYKSVLKTEAVGHKEQLDELRLKYLAKILLSDLNLVRNDVKAEAEAYHSLPATEKRRLKREALNKIQGRLANRRWK